MSDKKRIRVCYVIGSLKIGGAEHHLLRLLQNMDRSFVTPYVALFQESGAFLDTVKAMNIPIFNINLKKLYGWDCALKSLLFSRFLIKNEMDVVHSFLWQANFFASVTARFSGKKIIISKRNMNDWMGPSYLFLNGISNLLSHQISVVSSKVGKAVMKREKGAFGKIVEIPNGVDVPEKIQRSLIDEKKKELKLPTHGLISITVASLAPRKGHFVLLDAIAMILKKRKMIFLLVGDGILRKTLENKAQELGILKYVLFLGYRRDVSRLLQVADIFVLPSFEEGMSNALMEAMASELPVVATDVGGNSENINDASAGILVPSNNALAIKKGVEKLIDDNSFRTMLGENARKRIQKEFSVDRCVEKNLRMYLELSKKG